MDICGSFAAKAVQCQVVSPVTYQASKGTNITPCLLSKQLSKHNPCSDQYLDKSRSNHITLVLRWLQFMSAHLPHGYPPFFYPPPPPRLDSLSSLTPLIQASMYQVKLWTSVYSNCHPCSGRSLHWLGFRLFQVSGFHSSFRVLHVLSLFQLGTIPCMMQINMKPDMKPSGFHGFCRLRATSTSARSRKTTSWTAST